MKIGAQLKLTSVDQAQINLISSLERFLKQYRRWPYHTKLDEIRKPLIELKIAKRNARNES